LNLLGSLTERAYIENVATQYSRACRLNLLQNYCEVYTPWFYHEITLPYGTAPNTHWETKLRLKIKDEAVNLAESLYEWRQTAEMFHDAYVGAKDAWDIYRGRIKNLGKRRRLTTKDIASADLITSFGLMPLLSGVHDSYWALQERIANPLFRRFEVRAWNMTESTGGKGTNNFYPAANTAPYGVKWFRRQKAVVYVWFDVAPGGFTMGNPIELAWELIPFSWLVDGLIQVGDYLSSLDALTHVSSVVGTLSTKDRKTGWWEATASTAYNYRRGGSQAITGYQRQVITRIPYGYPAARPPKTWNKLIHAVSALRIMNDRSPYQGLKGWVPLPL